MTALLTSSSSIAATAARFIVFLIAAIGLTMAPLQAADAGPATTGVEKVDAKAAADHGQGEKGEKHVLPTHAPKIPGWGFINNSMIVTWIVAGLIIWGARRAMKNAKQVPTGGQNFWEFLVEGLHNFLAEILGPKLVKHTFWFFATIFIFIMAVNWFGLLPGVGTIGWGHGSKYGDHIHDHVTTPLFRGGNADLNMTSAMALTFFIWWIIWAVRENAHGKTGVAGVFAGIKGVGKHLFAPKGKDSGFMKIFMIVIFGLVGVLEMISIAFRPVSLSFRLFGNIFAGETTLESMQQLYPPLGWLIPVPFYFLELLVGLVQALVFMLLTSVFTLLICEHEAEEGHGDEAKAHH
jgi:F-type H+-transporting ATPase subunit a